jgi:hypothetical protein
LKTAVLKRIEALEARFKPSEQPELPPFEFDLLTKCEQKYFSLRLNVLRLKARELGYGDKNNNLSWFDLGSCDPICNEEVEAECMAALNAEEMKIIETLSTVIEKGIRITAALSDEEKAEVRRYNEIVLFFQNSMIRGSNPDRYCHEDLLAARRRYEEIMVEHGEAIYEQPIDAETN